MTAWGGIAIAGGLALLVVLIGWRFVAFLDKVGEDIDGFFVAVDRSTGWRAPPWDDDAGDDPVLRQRAILRSLSPGQGCGGSSAETIGGTSGKARKFAGGADV